MESYLLVLVGAGVVYLVIENDPQVGGALLLLLLLAMLSRFSLPKL